MTIEASNFNPVHSFYFLVYLCADFNEMKVLLSKDYKQFKQDTILSSSPEDTLISSDSSADIASRQDTSISIRKFTPEEIQSIFEASDRKQKKMDSIIALNQKKAVSHAITSPSESDTNKISKDDIPYLSIDDSVLILSQKQFIQSLSNQYFYYKDTSQPVIYDTPIDLLQTETPAQPGYTQTEKPSSPNGKSYDLNPDWLLGIVIGSLVVIAWLKLFYNKFFDQILQSIRNYQLSTKFLRDQNLFSRRVSLIMNIHFIIIGSLFFYLLNSYFNIIRLFDNGFHTFLFFSGCLLILLWGRYFISHLTGYLFNLHNEFRGYIHQLLLIYKNLGIYLIPIVIGIAYIHESLKIYVIYIGVVLFVLAYLLRFIKGFQIIIKKDVLIFYLILYLCTLEILPVLIIYKFLSKLI